MKTSLLLVVLVSWASADRKFPKYCQGKRPRMSCDGKGNPLNYIPRAPPDITDVLLTNIQLGVVTRAMMSNLTFCNLTSLYMKGNNITGLSPFAFRDLDNLQILDWQQAYLPLPDVLTALQNVHGPLKTLRLRAHQMPVQTLNASAFQHLTSLSKLTVALRSLRTFNADAFSLMPNLQLVDLSENSLEKFILEQIVPNVTRLILAGNNFVSVPQLCVSGIRPLIPRLRSLDLGNNAIRDLDVSSITCLKNLLKLSLGQNRIEELPNNVFANLHKLQSLHISNLGSLKRIGDLAFNSTSLYKFYFANNPILSLKRFNPVTLFRHTPNLGILDMTSTKMDISVYHLKAFLLNLRNTEQLVLQHTYIKELPSGTFSQLKKLKELVLSGNYLSRWKSDVFANVTSIKKISFDGCNIKTIKEDTFPLEFRLSVREINLSNNPFTCTCELLWFRNWMKNTIANHSIKFTQYPHRYECRAPNVHPLPLIDFNPTAKSCSPKKEYTVVLSVVLSIALVFIITTAVAYRYRWYLFYWMSLLRRRRQRRQNGPPHEMKYDAFVSYSNPDGDWVYDELMGYLEGEVGLRLCEHSRDFESGKLIVDNVFEALDSSRKTVLVISNEYMKSDWCQFELQMALNSFLKQETELVVILLEHIRACHVTSTLRALMTSTTYIEWPDVPAARQVFKQRLRNCLEP
ncbi:toll-like receptor 13 [Haliotis asinina]|uniref:toll-like receptor 13 n=1 Tax=Haliotis asinina TaxID=109174 RepID=UPI003531FDF9